MAYKNLANKSCANRSAALTELWALLSGMGWTLHDNQDGASYRVYKSNGELADTMNGYIKIDWITANRITIKAYGWWNNATQVGNMGAYSSTYLTTAETGFYLWVWGNKNLVYIVTKVSTTYYLRGFGHPPKKYWTVETDLTANATSGSNVVISVTDSSQFVVNDYYQIVGAAGEGRDRVQVTAKPSGTQLTIASLPRNYNTGSRIGQAPQLICHATANNPFLACDYDAVGTADAGSVSYCDLEMPVTLTYVDPDLRGGKYVLQPILWVELSLISFVAYVDEYIFMCPTTDLVIENILGVNEKDSGTSSGSNTSTTLNDTGKSWTINAFAGKVVLIKFGTGIGQIRKISSNTATELTVAENWTTIPDATSQYVIVDEAYRYMYETTVQPYAFREGV